MGSGAPLVGPADPTARRQRRATGTGVLYQWAARGAPLRRVRRGLAAVRALRGVVRGRALRVHAPDMVSSASLVEPVTPLETQDARSSSLTASTWLALGLGLGLGLGSGLALS